VALPAYSCFDIATAAVGADSSVLLYDVDPATLGPDPESLRQVLREGATTVVVVHLYGYPVDMSAVRALVAEEGARVVDDAAQGIGASYGERPAGSLGDVGLLSFGRGKGLTGGGGGALMGFGDRGAEALEAAGGLIDPGRPGASELLRATAQWLLGRPAVYQIPASLPFLRLGETVYREPERPAGLPQTCAGVIASTYARSLAAATARRRLASQLEARLEEAGQSVIRPVAGAVAGCLRLPVLLQPGVRQSAITWPVKRLGIARGYPRPLNELEPLASICANATGGFPGAKALAEGLVTLPTHDRVSRSDLTALGRWIETLP
jgi:dTDP-4-amino-4,6-dideoxygalactose transaminase